MKKIHVIIVGLVMIFAFSCRSEYKPDKKEPMKEEKYMSLDTTKDSVDRRDSLEKYEANMHTHQ